MSKYCTIIYILSSICGSWFGKLFSTALLLFILHILENHVIIRFSVIKILHRSGTNSWASDRFLKSWGSNAWIFLSFKWPVLYLLMIFNSCHRSKVNSLFITKIMVTLLQLLKTGHYICPVALKSFLVRCPPI